MNEARSSAKCTLIFYFLISSQNTKRNSYSRLEARDWKKEFLVLVLMPEINCQKFSSRLKLRLSMCEIEQKKFSFSFWDWKKMLLAMLWSVLCRRERGRDPVNCTPCMCLSSGALKRREFRGYFVSRSVWGISQVSRLWFNWGSSLPSTPLPFPSNPSQTWT